MGFAAGNLGFCEFHDWVSRLLWIPPLGISAFKGSKTGNLTIDTTGNLGTTDTKGNLGFCGFLRLISGSNVIPRRACPGLAGLRPHKFELVWITSSSGAETFGHLICGRGSTKEAHAEEARAEEEEEEETEQAEA